MNTAERAQQIDEHSKLQGHAVIIRWETVKSKAGREGWFGAGHSPQPLGNWSLLKIRMAGAHICDIKLCYSKSFPLRCYYADIVDIKQCFNWRNLFLPLFLTVPTNWKEEEDWNQRHCSINREWEESRNLSRWREYNPLPVDGHLSPSSLVVPTAQVLAGWPGENEELFRQERPAQNRDNVKFKLVDWVQVSWTLECLTNLPKDGWGDIEDNRVVSEHV